MKKVLITLIILCIFCGWAISRMKEKNNVFSPYDEVFEIQEKVDQEIKAYQEDSKYTIQNPKVLLNPYQISPLSALVIFQTKEETEVEVYINDRFVTKMKESKKHSIPIYGMLSNYQNKILFKTNTTEKEITIQTGEYTGDKVSVLKSSDELEGYYFVSPNFVDDFVMDTKGNVCWYLNDNYGGDIEFLENQHFYISDSKQGINGVKINYSSFLEMDYLGKIDKQWIPQYGIHHEIIPKENELLILGGKDDSPFVDSILYIIDQETGKTLYELDFYKFLSSIDPELMNSLGSKFDLVNNSASYDRDTNELLVSLRGVNSLMKINLETKEIKWIFGDPSFWGEKFSQYLLTVTDDTRYLGGQHSAYYLEDGHIVVHNNDIDQFDLDQTILEYYKDRYTDIVVLEVDEDQKTIHTVYHYDADKKYFSNVAGHIEFLENNYKLITYGWAMKEEAYQDMSNVMYTDPKYKNGVVSVINDQDEELFNARIDGLIYRTFPLKSFYLEETENYEVEDFKRIIGSVETGKEVNVSKLKHSKKKEFSFEMITNRFTLQEDFKKEDQVEIIFQKKDSAISYLYKEKGKPGPETFNSGFASIQVNLQSGVYDIYIQVNDKIYYTGKKVKV